MSELPEELQRLQAVELQLAELRRSRESRERRLEIRRRNVRKIEEKLASANREQQEHQRRLDALQLEVYAREESISRHRQALNRARTNKEYASILTAMNTEKADNAKFEAEMLDVMKEMDAAKAELDEIESERARLAEELAKGEAEMEAADRAVADELQRLSSEREQFASRLPPETIEAFNRASMRHDGEALAQVVKPRPRLDEYSCAGCNMKLTLEVVNALQARDEVQICGSCNRLLYLETSTTARR